MDEVKGNAPDEPDEQGATGTPADQGDENEPRSDERERPDAFVGETRVEDRPGGSRNHEGCEQWQGWAVCGFHLPSLDRCRCANLTPSCTRRCHDG